MNYSSGRIEIWSFCTNNVNAVSLAVTKINVFNLYQWKNISNNWSSNKLCLIYICITYIYNDKQHHKLTTDFIDAICILQNLAQYYSYSLKLFPKEFKSEQNFQRNTCNNNLLFQNSKIAIFALPAIIRNRFQLLHSIYFAVNDMLHSDHSVRWIITFFIFKWNCLHYKNNSPSFCQW